MAGLGAVQFRKEVGLFDAIFEGDAAQVVSEINSDPPYLSRFGHFIKSIHMKKQWFRYFSFVFAPRGSNSAAHTLAKKAACNTIDFCCPEDIPNCLSIDPLFWDHFRP